MGITISLPEINIKEDEVMVLLAIKLLEDGIVSLGKASEIAGYSERAFVEVLIHRGVAPIKYTSLNLNKELKNA
jgi:predicted HTH domain antitoxin